MEKAFQNFTWKNEPILETPLNAANLNSINNGLDTVDDRVIVLDVSKANQSDLLQSLKTLTYDSTTGVFIFTYWNGNTLTVDLNIEKIPVSFSMSPQGVITMTTTDGATYTANVADLIKTYTFRNSTDIRFNVVVDTQGNKTIEAYIVDGSVTASKLQPNYLADITEQAEDAASSADAALLSANASAADALMSESHNHGNTGVRQGEDTDNSKYYKEQCSLEGEAWTRGERGGQPVTPTDPTYQNNSRYFAQLANGYQQQAKQYRDEAQQIVGIGIATTQTAGIVKPDGTSITVESDGTITALQGVPDTQWAQIQAILGTT